MTIKIKGVIGWDIIGTQFADMIQRCSGDIDIEIDSPGGCVTDGISIFNALKRYEKGKINITVVGECSSMAAYIMLAGHSLKFEPNSIVVLHNPWSCGCGDYRAMLHEAEILKKMSDLYAGEFIKKGIFDEETIRAAMDSEKWFIGVEDLKLLGEVIERELPEVTEIDKQARITGAKNSIKAWQSRMQQQKGFKENLINIAALIDEMQVSNIKNGSTKTPEEIVNGKQFAITVPEPPKEIQNVEREEIMDLQELQTKHPELYAQVAKSGAQKEQSRVAALMQFIDDDKETVIKAINDGKSIQDDEIFAKLTRAKINTQTINAMTEENPADVDPKEAAHEPENAAAAQEQAEKEKEEKEQAVIAEIDKKLGLI